MSFSVDPFCHSNGEDSDEMLHLVAFYLGLHCLQNCQSTPLGVSSIQRVNFISRYHTLTCTDPESFAIGVQL